MVDKSAESTALAFLTVWVSRFGVPSTIITDRGGQLESDLWCQLLDFLGTNRHCTTSYHPQDNGMVKRFHHTLKDAPRSQTHPIRWADSLPLVLLRSIVKEDLHFSPADLVYSQTLHLPGEFQAPSANINNQHKVLRGLRHTVSMLRSLPPRLPDQQSSYIPPALRNSEYIWV